MSEKGQKIFKWFVWIALIAGIIVYAWYQINSVLNPPITRGEWKKILAEGFGDDTIAKTDGKSKENATGEYVALTSMQAIGEERLKTLTGEDELDDEKLVALAVDYGVVSPKKLENDITEKDAHSILLKAMDIYFSPEYYPEYCKLDTKKDAVDTSSWGNLEYDENKEVLKASIKGNPPKKGEVIIFTDEYGVAHARYVKSVKKADNQQYSIAMNSIDDISKVIDKISYSGSSDFSYLTSGGTPEQEDTTENQTSNMPQGVYATGYPLLFSENIKPIQLAHWEWFEDKTALRKDQGKDTQKCDIEFNVAIEGSEKNGKKDGKVTSYITVTSNGITGTYKFDMDDGAETLSKSTAEENKAHDFSQDTKKDQTADESNMEEEYSAVANVKLTDFSVCTSGYYQWADPNDEKNYVEVLASAKQIKFSSTLNMKTDDKYKIGSIPIPIASTAGTISVDLSVYLVLSASGEINIWYEINNPYTGLNVSVTNGFLHPHGYANEDAGFSAKTDLNGGFVGQAAIMVLDTVDLADPGVDTRICASASTVDVDESYETKEKYEDGVPCIHLNAQAPIVKMLLSSDEDSILHKLLDTLKIDDTYDLIKKDSALVPWNETYHMETEPDGNISFIEVKQGRDDNDVCTHIQAKKLSDLPDDVRSNVEEEAEKKKKEAQSKLEQALEAAIEKFFMDNCGDSF